MPSYWNIGIVHCTCGHFSHKLTSIEISLNIRWTFQSLSMSSKKGRPHGHRYGKKPGDKEYYTANQLKKKCQKRESTFQRLQQEVGEELHVLTYYHKHKQRELTQSSSSTLWKWQGSWWSSYNSESQEGGEPSLE